MTSPSTRPWHVLRVEERFEPTLTGAVDRVARIHWTIPGQHVSYIDLPLAEATEDQVRARLDAEYRRIAAILAL